MRKLLTLVLALGLLTTPVMAAESSALGGEGDAVVVNTDAAQPAPIPAWAYKELADGYAMGLFGDEIYTEHNKTVTQEQLDKITGVVADKLALLGVEQRSSAASWPPPGAACSTPCTWKLSPTPSRASTPDRWTLCAP